MMALQTLLLKLILLLNTTSILSYPNPIYGTKRYGRSSQQRVNTYDPYSYYQTPRYPVNYYKMNPYSQSYPDNYYYYPQESYQYPMYYAPARTSNYEVYQAVLPYYYQETPVPRQGYSGYYDYVDPVDEQEEVLQEVQREEREDNQPIGHESYYEDDLAVNQDESLEDVNAAFLQNLILSQMYQDSLDRTSKDGYDYYDEDFGRVDSNVNRKPSHISEDETVRELKQLSETSQEQQYENKDVKNNEVHWNKVNKQGNKAQRRNKQKERKQGKQETKRAGTQNDIISLNGAYLLYYDRKPIVKSTSSPQMVASSTEEPKIETRGQKEEFQMRPATPVRRPFASSVMQVMSGRHEKKRTPNVYDTIKHLLDMEKSFENEGTEPRPAMKKRIITPEESLTRQLTVLKKAQ